jgi:hypothetical protein
VVRNRPVARIDPAARTDRVVGRSRAGAAGTRVVGLAGTQVAGPAGADIRAAAAADIRVVGPAGSPVVGLVGTRAAGLGPPASNHLCESWAADSRVAAAGRQRESCPNRAWTGARYRPVRPEGRTLREGIGTLRTSWLMTDILRIRRCGQQHQERYPAPATTGRRTRLPEDDDAQSSVAVLAAPCYPDAVCATAGQRMNRRKEVSHRQRAAEYRGPGRR